MIQPFAIALLLATASLAPAPTTLPPAAAGALAAASASFANIADYRATIVVHETDGKNVQDRTYDVRFKKPMMERVDIVAGQDKGAGLVWLGGDTVKGHRGGFLRGIRLTLGLRNSMVTTLRGDTVDDATIPAMLDVFRKVKGTISVAPGPAIDGADSVAVALDVADPPTFGGITREVLYLSAATHLPVRNERFSGTALVKREDVTQMQVDVGLTASDFPW